MRRKPSSRTPTLLYVVALCFLAPLEAQERVTDDFVPVTDAMLRDPDPADWLMVHRTYDHHAYSPLDQINRENVGDLRLAWMRAMDNEGPQQLRPLVYDGVMYIAHPGSDHLQALDATTGDLIWDYRRELPTDLREYAQIGNRTRNLAIYGHNILHLSADAHLVAIDARTGEVSWESQLADYRDGITHSSGAIVIDGRVLSGRTCGPGNLAARCFIAAHDANTGAEAWRFYTAAGSDDPGGQTWGDLPTERRGHVSPWGLPGSYDPELGLVYWGIAVPAPYTRIVRRGTWDVGDSTPCELYSNSTVALSADTGAMDWYYQHLPCDDWDQDFVQERTLIDTVVNPDPDAVMWINPAVAGRAEERKVAVTLGESSPPTRRHSCPRPPQRSCPTCIRDPSIRRTPDGPFQVVSSGETRTSTRALRSTQARSETVSGSTRPTVSPVGRRSPPPPVSRRGCPGLSIFWSSPITRTTWDSSRTCWQANPTSCPTRRGRIGTTGSRAGTASLLPSR